MRKHPPCRHTRKSTSTVLLYLNPRQLHGAGRRGVLHILLAHSAAEWRYIAVEIRLVPARNQSPSPHVIFCRGVCSQLARATLAPLGDERPTRLFPDERQP